MSDEELGPASMSNRLSADGLEVGMVIRDVLPVTRIELTVLEIVPEELSIRVQVTGGGWAINPDSPSYQSVHGLEFIHGEEWTFVPVSNVNPPDRWHIDGGPWYFLDRLGEPDEQAGFRLYFYRY